MGFKWDILIEVSYITVTGLLPTFLERSADKNNAEIDTGFITVFNLMRGKIFLWVRIQVTESTIFQIAYKRIAELPH